MTAMVAPSSLGVRAEDVQDRRTSVAAAGASDRAGRFAAMLQSLNGVRPGGEGGASAASEYRVALGAVTLVAQGMEEPAEDPTAEPPKPDPDAAERVLRSALSDHASADVRWLTTLFTQARPQSLAALTPS